MFQARIIAALFLWLWLVAANFAADPPLLTANGVVSKPTANTLMIQPRGPDGKFEKKMVLKVRGTSKVTALSIQKREAQLVAVQRDVDIKDLQPGQPIAVIYAIIDGDQVLLSAVVQTSAK